MNAAKRTRIKICGITRLDDAMTVVGAGADALGLNFSSRSPRRIEPSRAAEITAAVDGRIARVGIFVDPEPGEVEGVLSRVTLDVLQFHGSEPAALCAGFGLPYMKAHRVGASLAFEALEASYPDACCHLLDAYVPGQPGGTGERFDWSLWPRGSSARLVLAGGLTPANVAEAVAVTRPWAVDVSGGVEAGMKGVKDPDLINRFVAAVREADALPAHPAR